MTDFTLPEWPYFLLAFLGLICHYAKTMRALRAGGEVHIHVWHVIKDKPYTATLSLIFGMVSVVLLAEAGQLTLAAAFLAGYAVESASEGFDGNIAKVYR